MRDAVKSTDAMSKNGRVSIIHNGQRYYWSERTGFVDEHWQLPPLVIQRVLQKKLEALLAVNDATIKDSHSAVRHAVSAKSQGHYSRAERLARHALQLDPQNEQAAAVLSSALRLQGRAKEALEVTDKFPGSANLALLTSRAAALLDVGDGVRAKQLARRVWAIPKERGGYTDEISMVFKRLDKQWPDLKA
jgi:hypothetical protein